MRDKRYFVLGAASFLVSGATRGAIYDTDKGSVFSLSEDGKIIVQKLDQGKSISEICKEEGVSKKELQNFLQKIVDLGLGEFAQEFRVREKVEIPSIRDTLSFVHCEITERCNFTCVHCYNSASLCKKGKELKTAEWVRILQEAYGKGCRRMQLVGGEPFCKRKTLFEVAGEARRMGYEGVEIFSNCSLLTARDIASIKDLKISMASSFYSSNEKIHNAITQKEGSWQKAIENFAKIVEQQIPLRVGLIISRANEATVEETKAFLKEQFGIEHIRSDYVRPAGRGCASDLISDSMISAQAVTSPSFAKTDLSTFAKRRCGHNCFMDKICISPTGDVHPCVMERDVSYGNVRRASLEEILASPTALQYRRMSKDVIEACSECEYRYCCFDCRVKARNGSDNITAKPWWCMYDPLKGEWKMSKKGGDEGSIEARGEC
ncbi:hypothetical protein A2524_02060 [Candidatus Wolfebacteria bacterium RIFOXYD12_FULL_48_21]|nr:MAG: hypothetical protein A2524_02060 [Candidatus Wolfebacteria bacterium RIFOXYD12_FULL_48_21]OGM95682.1 MAG: hypothetical protein A2532_02870 [Candidatus Wolfebacteria bacterium RIFOXYD2_FULL_48_11]